MRSNTLFLLLSLSCVCLALAQVSYDDCCLKYVKELSPAIKKHAVIYRRQELDGGCNIRAVIFVMRRGRQFCADPKESWVIKLMERIDRKKPSKPQRKSHRPRVSRP